MMPLSRIRRLFFRSIGLAILLMVLVLLYSVYVEPRWIAVSRYDISLPGLPKSLDGTTVVQISDLHRSSRVPDDLIKNAIDRANAEHPDVAVITGDFIGKRIDDASVCAKLASKFEAPMGTYAVLGNHDYWNGVKELKKSLKKNGITVLVNRNRKLKPGLYIIGLDDDWSGKPNPRKAWRGVDLKSGQLILAHSPLTADKLIGRKGLMLTGHTHGGQFTIPFVRRSRLPGLRGSKYISGWYKESSILMYVNRGIGMVMAPIRFRCRPEISVFRLHSASYKSNPKVISN